MPTNWSSNSVWRGDGHVFLFTFFCPFLPIVGVSRLPFVRHRVIFVMKTTVSLAAAATMAFAAPALAQPSSEDGVTVFGNAEAYCTLPTIWAGQSGTTGMGATRWNGTTLSIPSSLLAETTGAAITGGVTPVARIRGTGSCNTSHRIRLQSVNGGLVHESGADTPAPQGFIKRRAVTYEAFWRNVVDGVANTGWGVHNWTPSAPGEFSPTYNYVIGAANRPNPGERGFEVVVELSRAGPGGVMLAGQYSDQLIVTIEIAP